MTKTDWERLDKMTEEEIEKNALDDPDSINLSYEKLKKGKLVFPDSKSKK